MKQRNYNRYIEATLGIVMASTLAAMAVLVLLNVILRYFFSSGITWSEEMSRYLFVAMVFIGGGLAFKSDSHLSVDIIVKLLPEKGRKVAWFFSSAIGLLIGIVLVTGSVDLIKNNFGVKGPVTGIPNWVLYSFCLSMALYVVVHYAICIVRAFR